MSLTTIHRYLTKELLKYFCFVLMAVVGIYLAVDFFEKVDDFLDAKVPLSSLVAFFALRIPFIIAQVTPVGVLLAVLIVFGLMVRNNEIVALKSGGVRISGLFRPVLVTGLAFSVLVFFFSEVLVPMTMVRANKIWRSDVRKGSAVASKKKDVWIKGNRSISHIAYFNPSDKTIFGVTLNYFDGRFRLVRRVDAQKGIFTGDRWRLFNVVEQDLLTEDGSYEVSCLEEIPAKLDFVPEDLLTVVKKPEEMSYSELAAYIHKVEEEGYDATSYRVDLIGKISFPFVCVIMSLVGTGLAFWRKKKEGFAGSIVAGIGMAFVYWTLHSFCLSLGYGAMLPPIIAAWLTNGLFVCFGVVTLLKAN